MKIIGIGLPKTGTTSLYAALKNLGYKTTHYPARYHERIIKKGDYTLPKEFDAMVNTAEDFYPLIQENNPDIKFILTTRNIESWLASWESKDKPFGDQIERQYLNRIRIFGTARFVRQKFIHVYNRHENDAKKYFKDNTNFLILSLHDNDKWSKLCEYLDKPIPDCSYPHKKDRSKR